MTIQKQAETKNRIEMTDITKRFPGVVANDHVSFGVRAGEIHALLGENGAGKSTLMNILSGFYQPDEGKITIDGHPCSFISPKAAIDAGIGMIHQHFHLIEAFTVAENILLGDNRLGAGYNKRKAEAMVAQLANQFSMQIDPSARIWQLSVSERQTVEILKVLSRKANILVLDEPTAVLTPQEARRLFDTLKKMAHEGCAVIIITHKLAEVCEIANRVTILRKGSTVATLDGDRINYRELSQLLMGDYKEAALQPTGLPGEVLLEATKITVAGDKKTLALQEVSFTVNKGEILGVAGVSGNGQRELSEALAGLRYPAEGRLWLEGRDITGLSIRKRIAEGISFVPEDRLGTGLVSNMNIAENLLLRSYREKKAARFGFLRFKAQEKRAAGLVEKYAISVASTKNPVRLMSGGNLQKLLLARELESNPRLLITVYPVRGLDVHAAEGIFAMLTQLREKGTGVVLVGEDIDSLLQYCDRIMVLYRGRCMGITARADTNATEIGMMMMGTPLEEVRRYEEYSHF